MSHDDEHEIEELLDGREPMIEPPPELWDRIAAELDRDDEGRGRNDDRDDDTAPVTETPVVELRRRRRWIATAAIAAAAAVILVVIGLVSLIPGDEDPRRVEVALAPLPEHPGATGEATVIEDDDTYRIEFDVDGVEPGAAADLELWLLTPEVDELVSLGRVDRSGEVTVDDDVDLDEFSVLDLSIEPRDGDPTHSGNSVVRGTIDF